MARPWEARSAWGEGPRGWTTREVNTARSQLRPCRLLGSTGQRRYARARRTATRRPAGRGGGQGWPDRPMPWSGSSVRPLCGLASRDRAAVVRAPLGSHTDSVERQGRPALCGRHLTGDLGRNIEPPRPPHAPRTGTRLTGSPVAHAPPCSRTPPLTISSRRSSHLVR